MKTVKEVVLEKHTQLMQSRGINEQSSENMKFGRESAIDSLGIVELIMDIEEELDIEIDECLAEIRKCRTVGEMIGVVENYINNMP